MHIKKKNISKKNISKYKPLAPNRYELSTWKEKEKSIIVYCREFVK